MLTRHGNLVNWIGAVPTWALSGLGAGLLVFAAWVGWVAWRPTPARALVISALDVAWVVSTVPLVFVPGLLTASGVNAVLAVAFDCVSARACSARWGAAQGAQPGQGLWRDCVRVRVDAACWRSGHAGRKRTRR
ncbi:MAG: hypothetical protein GEU90_19415 [Gemmatimonas sp.]|nr:hypothetical protein [Gemmatimonas sp.]